MQIAKVYVNELEARTIYGKKITKGLRGGRVSLEYAGGIWEGLTKNVTFTNGLKTVGIYGAGLEVEIPPEVTETAGVEIRVGVCGVDGTGEVIPTVWASLDEVLEAVPSDFEEADKELTPSVTEQLLSRIGPMDQLGTEAKDSLVAAINEVIKLAGGDIDPEVLAAAVTEYLAENPIQETDPTVPAWAKQPTKPGYTAAEVGAQIADFVINCTYVDGEEVKPDKTWGEMVTAYESGARLICVYDGTIYDFVAYYEEENFIFDFYDGLRLQRNAVMMAPDNTAYIEKINAKDNQPGAFPVQSVNGKTGAVNLTAGDVGALPSDTVIPTVPTKVSAFTNDKGYQTEAEVNALINTALGSFDGGGSGGSGGSSGATGTGLWTLIREETLAEAVRGYSVTEDSNGNPFAYDELMITVFQESELASCGKLYYFFNGVQCGSPFAGGTGINRASMFRASRDGMIYASWAGNTNVKESDGGLDNIPQGSSFGMYFPAVASSSKLASAKLSTDWWANNNLQSGLVIRLWGRNK